MIIIEEIIRLDENFKEQFIKVYRLTFGEEVVYKFEKLLDNNEFWKYNYGIVDSGRLMAVHGVLDTRVYMRNTFLDAYYLSYVATLPSYRNQGCAKKLFFDVVNRCKRENIHLIFLDPFKHSYYRRWGCEICFDAHCLKMDFDFLSRHLVDNDFTVREGCIRDDFQLVSHFKKLRKFFWENPVYNEMKIPLCYEDAWFYNSDKYIAVVFDSKEQPRGYIRFSIAERVLRIYDFRYDCLKGFYALKKYLLAFNGQVNRIILENIPCDFPTELLIEDYWKDGRGIELLGFSSRMMRIINLKAVLEKVIHIWPSKDISFNVSDDFIDENSSRYTIRANGTIEKGVTIEGKNFTISISDFVSLISGRKSVIELYQLGKIEMPDCQSPITGFHSIPESILEFDSVLPKKMTFASEEM